MIKIQKDPITNKVLNYTVVAKNTPIYSTDILISESDIPSGLSMENSVFLSDDGIFEEKKSDDCFGRIDELQKQLAELSNEPDEEYFMRLIMDGDSLAKARELLSTRNEMASAIREEIDTIQKEHEKHVRDFYLEQNKQLDATLDCKYYSAVILLIKDENRYLKEWIDWHTAIGFDHIYIYDNGSKERVQDVVETFESSVREKITITDWTGHHAHIQQDAYNHFLENYGVDVRWGLFIDSDEFLRFTDGKTKCVNDFLRDYEDYTEIWGYEVEYDANGQESYEDKPVRERFTRRTDVREGFYWKNFIQVNRIDSFLMHYAYYDPAKHLLFKNEDTNQDLFVIDHYYTKSWEEWQEKIKVRGGADPNYHKALQEFFFYNPDLAHLNTGERAFQSYE